MIKKITLKVDDIVCTGCAEDMETILLDQDEILEANVKFADDIIDIKYDSEIIERPAVIHAAKRIANISEVIWEQYYTANRWYRRQTSGSENVLYSCPLRGDLWTYLKINCSLTLVTIAP